MNNASGNNNDGARRRAAGQISNGSEKTARVRWWHIAIGAGLAALLTLLAPRGRSLEFARLVVGSISPTKIIAPFDFEILKSPEELKRERDEAAGTVLPVLTEHPEVKEEHYTDLEEFARESAGLVGSIKPKFVSGQDGDRIRFSSEDSIKFADGTDRLFKRFGFRLSADTWKFLFQLSLLDGMDSTGSYASFFDELLSGLLLDIYGRGIINVPREQIRNQSGMAILQQDSEEGEIPQSRLHTPADAGRRLSEQLSGAEEAGYPEGAVSAAYEILQPFLAPNVIYNAVETDRRREAAIARVPLAKGLVKKDELIIDSNIRVTEEHYDKLRSLAVKRSEMQTGRGGLRAALPVVGHALLFLLVLLLLGLFVAQRRPKIWQDWKLILVTAIILALVHLFHALVGSRFGWSIYAFPVAVGVMMLGILVDRGVAMAAVSALALTAGLVGGNDFPLAFITVVAGGIAILAIRQVQHRGEVMRASIYLAAVYLPLAAAFSFISFRTWTALASDMGVGAINAVASPILVMGLVYLFEALFGITTELSLLELVDLNRPLLRELAMKSPGTYHHSIMVGSLAEAAARSIGANALLIRGGAYYHDIGKIDHKEYFIENQEAGSANIHDRLAPEKSAQIVIGHVQAGLELADKYRLPEQIKDFIREHHGRSRLAFFYAKAQREQGEDVSDDIYRYPGPNPQTRETGIMMLADLVEAATRSIEPSNVAEIRDTVEQLIKKRVTEGDLDHTPLTLRELETIKEAFVQVLSGIYHHRVPYPGQPNPKRRKQDHTQSVPTQTEVKNGG